jgi:hypothetical protein
MSHSRDHVIIDAIAPIFADPEIRQGLSTHQCSTVDAILQKDELTRRDKRKLLRALEDVLLDEGGED